MTGCDKAHSIIDAGSSVIAGGYIPLPILPPICISGIVSLTKTSGSLNWQVTAAGYAEFNDIQLLNMGTYNFIYGCGSLGSSSST
jgi:hypothetical protein